jgi:hypothetical protein
MFHNYIVSQRRDFAGCGEKCQGLAQRRTGKNSGPLEKILIAGALSSELKWPLLWGVGLKWKHWPDRTGRPWWMLDGGVAV